MKNLFYGVMSVHLCLPFQREVVSVNKLHLLQGDALPYGGRGEAILLPNNTALAAFRRKKLCYTMDPNRAFDAYGLMFGYQYINDPKQRFTLGDKFQILAMYLLYDLESHFVRENIQFNRTNQMRMEFSVALPLLEDGKRELSERMDALGIPPSGDFSFLGTGMIVTPKDVAETKRLVDVERFYDSLENDA